MPGSGVEHAQVPVLEALYRGVPPPEPVTARLIAGGTPNQDELGAGIALRAPDGLRSTAPLERCIAVDRACGHMCGGPSGNEFLAPAPHDQLWQAAKAAQILWAPTDALRDALVDWWAAHHLLISALWTPGGLRTACGRFRWAAKTPLGSGPSWQVDSLMHARLLSLPEGPLGHHPKVLPLEMWDEVVQRFGAAIRARMLSMPTPAVQSRVRVWERADGSRLAALEDEREMWEPLRAIEVGPGGEVLDGWVSLSDFPLPIADGRPAPPSRVVGRLSGSSDSPSPAPSAVPAPPPVPPAPPAPGAQPAPPPPQAAPGARPEGVELGALADRVRGLQVARRQLGLRDALAAELRAPLTRPLTQVAADVERLGIGPGQPQKADQDAIADRLRALE